MDPPGSALERRPRRGDAPRGPRPARRVLLPPQRCAGRAPERPRLPGDTPRRGRARAGRAGCRHAHQPPGPGRARPADRRQPVRAVVRRRRAGRRAPRAAPPGGRHLPTGAVPLRADRDRRRRGRLAPHPRPRRLVRGHELPRRAPWGRTPSPSATSGSPRHPSRGSSACSPCSAGGRTASTSCGDASSPAGAATSSPPRRSPTADAWFEALAEVCGLPLRLADPDRDTLWAVGPRRPRTLARVPGGLSPARDLRLCSRSASGATTGA